MTEKKTVSQIYKALLHPQCTATLVERSRKKMIQGVTPTKALVKKAEACEKLQSPKKSTPKRIVPKQVSPPKRIAAMPVSPQKQKRASSPMNYVNQRQMTQGQQKTATMMFDLFNRVENRVGKYGKKDKVLWN